MDPNQCIDIEGQELALGSSEIKKLTSSEGCPLQLVTERVHNVEDTIDSEDGESGYDEDHSSMSKQSKAERMNREYISLVLNANRDPIKPGTKCDLLRLSKEDDETDEGFSCVAEGFEDKYIGIHKTYENIGSFNNYMEANSFEEIVPGLVFKKIRAPGTLKVTETSFVIYNCALWSENSKEPFDSTWLRRTTLSAHMTHDLDTMLPGLYQILLTMKKGEICEAFMRPEMAFGRMGAMPRIPANATIFCLIEVVKVVPEDKMAKLMRSAHGSPQEHGLTFEDFYAASDEARRRGNYFYEQNQYFIALQRYKSAVRLLEALVYKNHQEESQAKELLIKLFNNIARTANALKNPRVALAACKQASEVDDKVPKTHWHRMTAWALKGHYDRALGVARRAMQLFPEERFNRPFREKAGEFKAKLQEDARQLDELHRLMGRSLITHA